MTRPDPARPVITLAPEVARLYRESIAANPPETVALLGGRLDAPYHVTDFFFLPPRHDGRGFVSGAAHVQPDHHALNYLIDRVLVPAGKYMLGLWHSHPGDHRAPSGPDLAYCGAILRNDDSPGRAWHSFLAPITTFDPDGRARVTGWVLHRDANGFAPAAVDLPDPAIAAIAPQAPAWPPPPVEPAPRIPAALTQAGLAGDALAAGARELAGLLAHADGLDGVQRHRMRAHLQGAWRILAAHGVDGLTPSETER